MMMVQFKCFSTKQRLSLITFDSWMFYSKKSISRNKCCYNNPSKVPLIQFHSIHQSNCCYNPSSGTTYNYKQWNKSDTIEERKYYIGRDCYNIINNKKNQNNLQCQRYFSSLSSSTTSSTTTSPADKVYDIVIVGGGVVGSALAHRLTRAYRDYGEGGDSSQAMAKKLTVAIIEASNGPDESTATVSAEDPSQSPPHPRSYALSPASMEILGLSSLLQSDQENHDQTFDHRLIGGYYNSMQIWEAKQPSSLLFTHHDLARAVNEQNFSKTTNYHRHSPQNPLFLGCCVEDHVLQQYLWKEMNIISSTTMHNNSKTNNSEISPDVTLFRQARVSDFQLPSDGIGSGLVTIDITGKNHNETNATTSLTPTTTVQTRLLVAADGANSQIRQKAGFNTTSITSMKYDYNQTALTFTVELKQPIPETLRRRAFQRFLTTGPIALLPTWSPYHAVVVWSTTPTEVERWKNHPDLASHINDLFQVGPELLNPLLHQEHFDYNNTDNNSILSTCFNNLLYGIDKVVDTIQYGAAMAVQQGPMSAAASTGDPNCVFQAPPLISSIVSSQLSFPLKCQQVSSHTLTKSRLALIGDAAHTVHPMAGQGLNLGLQDVEALAQAIEKAFYSGMDVATFVDTDYERSRTNQVTATVQGIHALHNIFVQQQSTPAKHIKSLGMSFIQACTPLRTVLVQAACQGVLTNTSTLPSPVTR